MTPWSQSREMREKYGAHACKIADSLRVHPADWLAAELAAPSADLAQATTLSRPPARTFRVRGQRWEAHYYHGGLLMSVSPLR